MADPDNKTFVSYAELLSAMGDRCLLAETYLLEARSGADDPWGALVEELADRERGLGESLKAFSRDGPEDMLSQRIQYTLEMPTANAPDSLNAAIDELARTNDEIESLLGQQAEKATAGTIREEFRNLRETVEAISRKISMIRVTSSDV